jgi:hypothetical protein
VRSEAMLKRPRLRGIVRSEERGTEPLPSGGLDVEALRPAAVFRCDAPAHLFIRVSRRLAVPSNTAALWGCFGAETGLMPVHTVRGGEWNAPTLLS